ncbi:hypothetical protein ABTN50_20230, partial [Acinetobacter baumannii]
MDSKGLADYAAANGFMDAYAIAREAAVARGERHGRTLSLNWPLWAEGGMRVDAPMQERIRRETGLVAMPTAVGVAVLEQV